MLATAAAAMPVGTWRRFTGTTQDGVSWPVPPNQTLHLSTVPGGVGSILPYMNKAAWNPIAKQINIIGKAHGEDNGLTQVNYREASHDWEGFGHNQYTVNPSPPPTYIPPNGPGVIQASYTGGHAYDHSVVNPFNGDLYSATYGLTGTFPVRAFRRTVASPIFTDLPTSPAVQQCGTNAVCWWKGVFTGGAGLGAQGGFVFYSRKDTNPDGGNPPAATDGSIAIFSPDTNTWVFVQNSMSPFMNNNLTSAEQNAVMAYSAVHNCAVYGGGHANTRRLWRLNSDGTKVELSEAPVDIGIHYSMFLSDPVTGNFLIIRGTGGTDMWELDPTGAGTYTQMIGSRVPPNIFAGREMDNTYACCVELPDHGVIATIQEASQSSIWLYKHA